MRKIIKSIATLGYIGYLPACGTMATLVTLPYVYCISFMHISYQMILLLLGYSFAFFVIKKSLSLFTQKDPKEIVIDEFVGTLVTFLGITYDPVVFCVGFILFRFFDIFKLLGIAYIEKLPDAYGVLLDDCLAGLFANIIIRYLFL